MKIFFILFLTVFSIQATLVADVVSQDIFVEGNASSPLIILNSSVRGNSMTSANINAKKVSADTLSIKKLSAKAAQVDVRAEINSSFEEKWCSEEMAVKVRLKKKLSL